MISTMFWISSVIGTSILAFSLTICEPVQAKQTRTLHGTNTAHGQIDHDTRSKPGFLKTSLFDPVDGARDKLYDATGFKLNADYIAAYYKATDSLGKSESAAGVGRIYGEWDIIGRGKENTTAVVYFLRFENSFTDLAPTELAPELGYTSGAINGSFTDLGARLTALYFRQRFYDDRLMFSVGLHDANEWIDVTPFNEVYTGFQNSAFGTGMGALPVPADASFGARATAFLTENLYGIVSISDLNSDPENSFNVEFFDEFETLKTIEVGWTSGHDALYSDNLHVTLWQADERTEVDIEDGWGLAVAATKRVGEHWAPFLRAVYADGAGTLPGYGAGAGFAYHVEPDGDVLALGLGWLKPNKDTYGRSLDGEFTGELFYRWQFTENFQITPSVQLIGDPALNPEHDVIGVFGVRLRVNL